MSNVDLLDRIDEVTAAVCAQCDGPLGGSPSDDFCSADCQAAWTAHERDVQDIVGYREAMSIAVGWCEDEARWEPTLTVGDWTVTARWMDALFIRARAAASVRLTAPTQPLTVTTIYVAPGRTDNAAEDAWVCDVAARWATRLGLHDEAAAARAMSREATAEFWGEAMEGVRSAMADLGRGLTQAFQEISKAFAPLSKLAVKHHAADPDESPAVRALRLRQTRNTGPQVHADPRRNRR